MWIDEKFFFFLMKALSSKAEPFHKIDDLKKIESKRKKKRNFLEGEGK